MRDDFKPDQAVKVCADSWEQLRKGDVYRLFNTYEDGHWTAIFKRLKAKRPDLVDEAREVMADLEADMYGGTRVPEL